jgi:hypothetical protein
MTRFTMFIAAIAIAGTITPFALLAADKAGQVSASDTQMAPPIPSPDHQWRVMFDARKRPHGLSFETFPTPGNLSQCMDVAKKVSEALELKSYISVQAACLNTHTGDIHWVSDK